MDEWQIVREHTLAVRELNQTMADLLARLESKAPAEGGAMRELIAPMVEAMGRIQTAQPQGPVTVAAEFKSPTGATWEIDAKRKADGFQMTVVKVA